MTEQDVGRLDQAIDQTIRHELDQSAPEELRARVLTQLTEASTRPPAFSGSLVWRVSILALAVGVVAIVVRLLAPPTPGLETPLSTEAADDPGASGVVTPSENESVPSTFFAAPPAGNVQDRGGAISAAPPAISTNATVMNWDGTIVSQGDNAWTCLPDRPDTQQPDPWCFTDTSLIDLMPQAIRVGGTIRPPRKVQGVSPVYPPAALEAREGGVVILEMVIGPDGTVGGVRRLRSSGNELLDQSAFEAVLGWRYSTTLMNGRPVPVIMTMPINYSVKR